MSSANARQVDGDHYKTGYEHWDFIEDVGLGYLEGYATKYIIRWRKKNGLKDLQKADHCIEKLIEKGRSNRMNISEEKAQECLDRFLNTIPDIMDATLVEMITFWEGKASLLAVRDTLKELMLRHEDGTPITDSNRHAR